MGNWGLREILAVGERWGTRGFYQHYMCLYIMGVEGGGRSCGE